MDAIRLRQSPAVPAALVAVGLLLGGFLGWFGPALARGLADLLEQTPIPVHGLIRVLAGFDHTWSLPVLGGAGLLGGILLAVAAASEAPELDVIADHLEYRHGEREVWVERREIDTAFRDGRDLVLLRPDGGLGRRLDVDDLPPERLRSALTTSAWPLRDHDPFDGDFEPWLEGRPGFTGEQDALLRRRRDARKDPAVRQTVDERLTEAGLVVRVRSGRLQVRSLRRR